MATDFPSARPSADHGRAAEPLTSDDDHSLAPLNFDELLHRCLGNRELAQRVLTKFQVLFAHELQAMRQRFEAGDWEEVGRLAHRVRGSAANVAAAELSRLATELEGQARLRLHCEASRTLRALEHQWRQFQSYVGVA